MPTKTCTKQTLKKYTSKDRKSPPFPANECQAGMKKKGNDGKFWISTPDKNGTRRWKPVAKVQKKA